jgi:hypothetical protein
VWALMAGLRALAARFIQGKIVADILLETEEKWPAADNYDQAELRAFAVKFCDWANEVLAPTKPVGDRLRGGRRKIAKGSAVRVVVYHKN